MPTSYVRNLKRKELIQIWIDSSTLGRVQTCLASTDFNFRPTSLSWVARSRPCDISLYQRFTSCFGRCIMQTLGRRHHPHRTGRCTADDRCSQQLLPPPLLYCSSRNNPPKPWKQPPIHGPRSNRHRHPLGPMLRRIRYQVVLGEVICNKRFKSRSARNKLGQRHMDRSY